MGIISGKYEWVKAKKPVQLVVKLNFKTSQYVHEYDMDLGYTPGWLADDDWAYINGRTAEEQAQSKAAEIRKYGLRVDGKHYPVHRIHEITIVPCKWVTKEVPTQVSAIEPIGKDAK